MPPEHVNKGYDEVQRGAVLVLRALNNYFRLAKSMWQ
jgi:hypothetical protein